MVKEVVAALAPREGGIYVDGTVGDGGHSKVLLEKIGHTGTLICIDRDQEALESAMAVLAPWREQCRFARGNFADMRAIAGRMGIRQVNGVLLDLGMSSGQVDRAERGFSFMRDGPLDMRMDLSQETKASDLVEELSEEELERIIGGNGEERFSRKIARAIVIERRGKGEWTTGRLAGVIAEAVGGRKGKTNPATRTFQALRIEVNKEMEALAQGLEEGLALLAESGRMAVISYHSLEDRQVKQVFKKHVGHWESLPEGGRRWEGLSPVVKPLMKKPLCSSQEEIAVNPRARSAKLRCIERI